jgi:restriction system protein
MGRRSRSKSFDIARLILALLLLGGIALFQGDIKTVTSLRSVLSVVSYIVIISVTLTALLGLVIVIAKMMGWVRRNRLEAIQRSYESRMPSKVFPVSSPTGESVQPPAPVTHRFTLDLLNQIEWRRFEKLVEGLFLAEGKTAERLRAGADGGIDLVLRDSPEGPITGIVQCKSWKTYSVGVKPVRELFGVMHAEGASYGHFITSGRFTAEATEFAKYKPLALIDGPALLIRLNAIEETERNRLFQEITSGDYCTPTCPSCDIQMVKKKSAHGEFWGCRSFPRCRQTFRVSV